MLMWQRQVLSWLDTNERTQRWLASKAGISPSYMHHYLAGERDITDAMLSRLGVIMGERLSRRGLVRYKKGTKIKYARRQIAQVA